MTESERQKKIRKIAEEPFENNSFARVGWTADEIVQYAEIYGMTWTSKKATTFLRKNRAKLEDVMLTAGLQVVTKALKIASGKGA